MPQAEGLADSTATLVQNSEQQAIPQVVAGVQDRLGLPDGKDPGMLARRREPDRPARLRLAFADVVQERPPRCPPATGRLPGGQQLAEVHAVPGGMLVERAHGRELPVHRGLDAVVLHRRQHGHPPVPALRRQPQPRHELTDVLQPDLSPVQAPAGEEREPVLQVVRVRLDRVR
jgi:hypothetical protein